MLIASVFQSEDIEFHIQQMDSLDKFDDFFQPALDLPLRWVGMKVDISGWVLLQTFLQFEHFDEI